MTEFIFSPSSNELGIIHQVESIEDGCYSIIKKVKIVSLDEPVGNAPHYKKSYSYKKQASIDSEVRFSREGIDSQGNSNCECH